MNNTKPARPVKPAPRVLRPKPSVGIIPLLISDQTAFVTIGLTGGQLRDVVKKHGIPHRLVGQRLLVAIDDLLAFVREGVSIVDARRDEPATAPEQPDDVDAVLAVVGKRRTA